MSSLYDLVARNVMTGVVRVLMAGKSEPAARDAARLTWEFSSEVCRDDALVVQLAAALNLSAPQLDQLFTTAGGL